MQIQRNNNTIITKHKSNQRNRQENKQTSKKTKKTQQKYTIHQANVFMCIPN